jgi:hypothetical protein
MRVCNCTLGKNGRCCQDKQPTETVIPWSLPPGLLPSRCTSCSAELPIGANFCPSCGIFVGLLGSPT